MFIITKLEFLLDHLPASVILNYFEAVIEEDLIDEILLDEQLKIGIKDDKRSKFKKLVNLYGEIDLLEELVFDSIKPDPNSLLDYIIEKEELELQFRQFELGI